MSKIVQYKFYYNKILFYLGIFITLFYFYSYSYQKQNLISYTNYNHLWRQTYIITLCYKPNISKLRQKGYNLKIS